MILNIDINEFYSSRLNNSIYVKETSSFITVSITFTFNVAIHSLITVEWIADRNVKVDYDVISYEVRHIAVKTIGKP